MTEVQPKFKSGQKVRRTDITEFEKIFIITDIERKYGEYVYVGDWGVEGFECDLELVEEIDNA